MDDKASRTESGENILRAGDLNSPGTDDKAEGKGKGKGKKSAAKEFMTNVAEELTDRAMRGGVEWVGDQKKKFLFPDREREDKRRDGKENADAKPSVSPGGETPWTGLRPNETQGKFFHARSCVTSLNILSMSPSLSGTTLQDLGCYHANINDADIRVHFLIPNSIYHSTR